LKEYTKLVIFIQFQPQFPLILLIFMSLNPTNLTFQATFMVVAYFTVAFVTKFDPNHGHFQLNSLFCPENLWNPWILVCLKVFSIIHVSIIKPHRAKLLVFTGNFFYFKTFPFILSFSFIVRVFARLGTFRTGFTIFNSENAQFSRYVDILSARERTSVSTVHYLNIVSLSPRAGNSFFGEIRIAFLF
jgi:hypothetical protein